MMIPSKTGKYWPKQWFHSYCRLSYAPMLVSIIAKDYYFDDYENSKYLSLILLIVPVVLIISLVLAAKQDWLNKKQTELTR